MKKDSKKYQIIIGEVIKNRHTISTVIMFNKNSNSDYFNSFKVDNRKNYVNRIIKLLNDNNIKWIGETEEFTIKKNTLQIMYIFNFYRPDNFDLKNLLMETFNIHKNQLKFTF